MELSAQVHAVGARVSGGLPSRPGAFEQAPVGVEVERKRGSTQGGGAADAHGGDSGAKGNADLRAGFDKLKKDLATLRKTGKGKWN